MGMMGMMLNMMKNFMGNQNQGQQGQPWGNTGKASGLVQPKQPPVRRGSAAGGGAGGGKGQVQEAQKGGGKVWENPNTQMRRMIKHVNAQQCLPGAELGDDDNCLFISGLPKDTSDLHLYKMFSPFGGITPTGCRAMKNPDGTCKGIGFINYVDPFPAELAQHTLDQHKFSDGSILGVTVKSAPKK